MEKFRDISCNEINQNSIIDYLASQGIKPSKKVGDAYFYLSPIRKENTPSFSVSRSKNVWYDHGIAEGGKLVDLCMKLHNETVGEVVRRFAQTSSFSFRQLKNVNHAVKDKINYKILQSQPVKEKRLLDYLCERCISFLKIRQYVKEYHYELDNRQYIAFGFKNVKSGYELRNSQFKGTLGNKGVTYFKGHPESNSLLIFEGMMDMFSYMSYTNTDYSNKHYLVLNSATGAQHAAELALKMDIKPKLFLFMDNDAAGKAATKTLIDTGLPYKDMSYLYQGFNDYNDFLKDKLRPRRSRGMSM